MEDKKKVSVNISGSFTGLLTIAFIILKLCGVINWSWIWVLAPLWISMAIVVGLALIALVVALVCKEGD